MNVGQASFQVSDWVHLCVCVMYLHHHPLLLPPHLIYIPGEGWAARPGRRAGTTSKKMGAGLEGGATRGEVGGKRVGVTSGSHGGGTQKTHPHLLGSPTLSLPMFASFLFRAPVERGGNQVPQGNQAPRYGVGGWSGPPSRPSAPGSPSPTQYLLVEFVLQPESHSFHPRVMWARTEPLGSLEKR